jgi:hypothetical protein
MSGAVIVFHVDTEVGVAHYEFRRATPDAVAISPGLYTLASVNARADLASMDTVINGERHVSRVVFDSLAFIDRVFYRRHRSQSSTTYVAGGDSISSGESWAIYGSYANGGSGSVILRSYATFGFETGRDSLTIADQGLVRRTLTTRGVIEERYERRR